MNVYAHCRSSPIVIVFGSVLSVVSLGLLLRSVFTAVPSSFWNKFVTIQLVER